MKSLWRYLGGTITSPVRTFQTLRSDPKKISKGFKAILLMGVLYTVTVALLTAGGALITAPAVISISSENYYFFEIFFALPVVAAGWILAAGFARLLSRWGRGDGTFEDTLAALGFAMTVPMFVTWIPETVFAVLLLLGMKQEEFMELLEQPGFLQIFAFSSQIVAVVWMLVLIMIAVGVSQKLKWGRAVLVGFLTTVLFMAVMLIFIR
ncbi:MAG: YIP1 family protein [Candidatus Aminicenantes bacterium]|nr:YIP1 family protein [Candidatus Aminicenantes bacterium]